MTQARVATSPRVENTAATVNRFVNLAVRGLVPMFDRQRQLFCYRLKKTDQGMVREDISHRYTAMTLLGLHQLGQAGTVSPFDTESILQTLLSDVSWVDNIGDLGVLLWLCAVVCPQRLSALEPRLRLETALKRFQGARQGATMELAWFLTGLSYWGQAYPEKLPRLEALAFKTYDTMTRNQGDRGFFGHLSTSRSLSGLARGRIGSFADQVYPIYAMAQFSKAYQHEEAADRALKCAVGICEVQGPLGQWWWHYDAPGGRVTEGYPVFSVHQHAMGPMTLFGLGEAINRNFDEWIYKGLHWINSDNELGYDMEDASRCVIWRCIFRSRRSLMKYFRAGFGRHSDTVQHPHPGDLKILFECRPYELGWLLYAFSSRARKHSPRADGPTD
ncbi:hypothetical protein SBA1_30020 [Candidatus Sulfotelmatobacter kueseliae]|uniref:Uncharacterized protein n=1 Tax=Candidatus Sulfotelmatobacter kueseliae TaxID=2042962 RepID=A0A2U3KKH5_9BACT|nr:hypothetical protein SBA1_30020 [Candidatus Sulfotelmatobacter kueseliae]